MSATHTLVKRSGSGSGRQTRETKCDCLRQQTRHTCGCQITEPPTSGQVLDHKYEYSIDTRVRLFPACTAGDRITSSLCTALRTSSGAPSGLCNAQLSCQIENVWVRARPVRAATSLPDTAWLGCIELCLCLLLCLSAMPQQALGGGDP